MASKLRWVLACGVDWGLAKLSLPSGKAFAAMAARWGLMLACSFKSSLAEQWRSWQVVGNGMACIDDRGYVELSLPRQICRV